MTLINELFELVDSVAATRSRLCVEDLQKAFSAIREVCNQAKRSWSGSSLGYHATIYFDGITPKPAGVNFSSEWGIEDNWPVNSVDPGWQNMDFQDVIDELVARAGSPNIDDIEDALKHLGDEFLELKDRALSIFTVLRRGQQDAFLDRKFEQIESLKWANRATIARTLIGGPSWSRDSLAVSQGHRVAPHQSLLAVDLSATVLDNGLESLEKAVRATALHLERIEQGQRKMTATGKTVFIGHGHSKEWHVLKDFLGERLHLKAEEFNSSSVAGIATPTRLEEMLDQAAFAFLILTAEDEQPDGTIRARENVVHEAGLFQGRLGFRKAIILLEDGCAAFSNIDGLCQIRFPKSNVRATFEEIRRVLEREGLVAAATK